MNTVKHQQQPEARGVQSPGEMREALALMANAHAQTVPAARDWLEDRSSHYPGFRPEHTRVVMAGGRVAAAMRMTTDTIAIGEARLKMGGVGWVVTAPAWRGKGLCRRLMADAMAYMSHNNYHVSMLFGIPNLYGKLGYTTTLADHVIRMDTAEALTFTSPLRLMEAPPTVIPAMQALHAECGAGLACSLIRTSAHYLNRWERWRTWYMLTSDDGKVLGYFIARQEGAALRVDDVALAYPGLCAGVIAAAGRLAADASLSQLRLGAPPPHPLARYLLQFRSVHETSVDRDAGGMMAFVSIAETLESMLPEWESRLARDAPDLRAEVTLCTAGQTWRIRANRGAVDVAMAPGANRLSIGSDQLMHLVTGYRHPEDILDDERRLLTANGRRLLLTICPKRTPFVWPFDRF